MNRALGAHPPPSPWDLHIGDSCGNFTARQAALLLKIETRKVGRADSQEFTLALNAEKDVREVERDVFAAKRGQNLFRHG